MVLYSTSISDLENTVSGIIKSCTIRITTMKNERSASPGDVFGNPNESSRHHSNLVRWSPRDDFRTSSLFIYWSCPGGSMMKPEESASQNNRIEKKKKKRTIRKRKYRKSNRF